MNGNDIEYADFFYDTEFIEDGEVIKLISIGIVRFDGEEYYAISKDFDPEEANDWVKENVLPKLPCDDGSGLIWKSNEEISKEVEKFLDTGDDRQVRLWAWMGCYDHVVLAQLFGDMSKLPKHVPMFTHDIRQYWEFSGRPEIPESKENSVHCALYDAKHAKSVFESIRRCQGT